MPREFLGCGRGLNSWSTAIWMSNKAETAYVCWVSFPRCNPVERGSACSWLSSAHEGCGPVGAGPNEAMKIFRGGAPLLWRQAQRSGVVLAGEEKALGRPWGAFQCQMGPCKKDGNRLFSRPVKCRCEEGIWYSENGETLERIPRNFFFSFFFASWCKWKSAYIWRWMPPAKGMKAQSCFLQAYRGTFWEVLEEGNASGHLQYISHSTVIIRGNATHRWSAKANESLDSHTVNILTPFHRSNYCVVNLLVCSICPDLDF